MKIIFRARRFWKNEAGATAIEYAIITLLIGVASVYGFTRAGYSVRDIFEKVAAGFS